jgi:PDZ domain-containing protein
MKLRSLTKTLTTVAAVLFLALVALYIYAQFTYSSSYLLLPDKPHALAPLVKVKDGHESSKGDIYFVDVIERRASLAERYLPFLRRDATLVSEQDLGPSNVSDKVRASIDAASMALSKKTAEAVALRNLGYKVIIRPHGALVEQTAEGKPVSRKLLPGDVITAVDGKPALEFSKLHALIAKHRVGQFVELTFTRNGRQRHVALRTYASSSVPRVAYIGVIVTQAASIKLPIGVSIDAENVGGPSAGLAFALELSDKLGHDIDRGHRIAATGELALNGSVQPIGGVKQKVIGARRAGIEIMLVPAGDNATEARRYAGSMKIIPVTSFQQALRALATAAQKG